MQVEGLVYHRQERKWGIFIGDDDVQHSAKMVVIYPFYYSGHDALAAREAE